MGDSAGLGRQLWQQIYQGGDDCVKIVGTPATACATLHRVTRTWRQPSGGYQGTGLRLLNANGLLPLSSLNNFCHVSVLQEKCHHKSSSDWQHVHVQPNDLRASILTSIHSSLVRFPFTFFTFQSRFPISGRGSPDKGPNFMWRHLD